MGENTSQKPQDTDADNFGDELFADLAPKDSKRRSAMPPPPPPPQPPGGLFKADSNPQNSAPQISQSFARSAPPSAPPSIRNTPTRPSLAPPPPSKRGTVPPQASKSKPPSLPKKTEIGLAPPLLPAEISGEVVAADVPVEPSAPQSWWSPRRRRCALVAAGWCLVAAACEAPRLEPCGRLGQRRPLPW